jgi:uncharacterized ion transporter superfamily protein YfcC
MAVPVPVMVLAIGIWAWGTMRYARRHRTVPSEGDLPNQAISGRHAAVLVTTWPGLPRSSSASSSSGWGFEQMAGVFLGLGLAAGVIGGLGIEGTCAAFVEGFGSMSYAVLMIGVARGVFVVSTRGTSWTRSSTSSSRRSRSCR